MYKRLAPMRSQQYGYLKHCMHKENTSWYANGGEWKFTHTHIHTQRGGHEFEGEWGNRAYFGVGEKYVNDVNELFLLEMIKN